MQNGSRKATQCHHTVKPNRSGTYAPSNMKCSIFLNSSSLILVAFRIVNMIAAAGIRYPQNIKKPLKNSVIFFSVKNVDWLIISYFSEFFNLFTDFWFLTVFCFVVTLSDAYYLLNISLGCAILTL